jgi:hypothetical protein
MKTITMLALLLPLISFSQYKLSANHLTYNKTASTTELKKFSFENLRLYPIIAKDSFKAVFKNLNKFTPLKKALAQKKVVITEKGDGGEVSTLLIENKSKDTIIINSGEVIKGGQQDRVINTDMVLYPNSGKKDLSVFCVEAGRWSPRSESARSSNNSPVPNQEMTRANQGTAHLSTTVKSDQLKFDSVVSFGAMGLRSVVDKEKNQAKVWNKVEEINIKNSTTNATSTYTALDQSADYNKKMSRYISFFTPLLKEQKDIVGVIVVTGNKVIGADIFATNDLFIQNLDALLHSYATDAIVNGKSVTITQATVDKYISELLGSEMKQAETIKKKGSKFVHKGKNLRISAFE